MPLRHLARCWPFCLLLAAPAATAQTIGDALADGDATLALRYRYEFVDQDGLDDNANASTLRGRLTFTSGAWRGWTGLLEFDAVQTILLDDYNSGAGTSSARRSRYPVVADPDYTEVNQIYVQYAGAHDTRVRVGRQRILLDNQRFIGGVGWRQNEQTYDALSVQSGVLPDTTLFYAYVDNVNRIFGDDVPDGDNESDTHLLNAAYQFGSVGKLTGYVYAIDNETVPSFSTTTYGLRFVGDAEVSNRTLNYQVEYAGQSDAANNPVSYSAQYFALRGSLDVGAVTPSLAYEHLSGSSAPGRAFRTPMATLHGYNGWADLFLGTPDAGLTDLILGVDARVQDWTVNSSLHFFGSDVGSRDYGVELDVSAGRALGKRASVLLKFAHFDADDAMFGDVTKVWVMLSAAF